MSRNSETIFHEARELTGDTRAAFLRGACGTDLALRAKVDALLAADADAGSFLKSVAPTAAITADVSTATGAVAGLPAEQAGQMIGRYKLLQPIGEGGFGTVWLAEQKEPVKRRVALKIIKLGMDTKQVIARFEAERQALAMMEHPNIAKVLDAGSTEIGRPYFVMEYVRGMGMLEYCDLEKLDTEARLRLFIPVCQAIQHAHQKGIIHRDIKPSNVLVTLHDGVPVPKVIDFGVAKATNTELTQKTLFTEHRQMIGTPAYMSPEQAEMSGLDIDTRTDIYSLGVLLYELLTGTTPFDARELMSGGFAEMMRIIRETEPQRPSTRLTALGETGTTVAEQRRADTRRLGILLRGDLDWIVMKCLEKDRTRRYETANGLAADIGRHLRDEPVVAGPPSTTYRLRKYVHRNRAVVAVTAAMFLILAGGLSVAIVGMLHAREGQRAAELAQERERLAREAAEAARSDQVKLARVLEGDISIAVRPLINASGDPEQDYIAVGMTNSLAETLQRLDGAIDVKSLDSVERLLALGWTDAQVANELGVDLLLSGSILRVGDQVRVTMSLDHPGLEVNFWRNTYTAAWADLFRLQQQVSKDTLREVPRLGSPQEDTRLAKRDTTNPLAREAYYKGMHNLRSAGTRETEKAIEFFDEALRHDSDFALAYLGKATAYMRQATLGVDPDAHNVPAREAALAAIDLDDTLAGAWAVLGAVQLQYDWKWDDALRSFQTALELDPYLPSAHAGLASYYVSIGDFDTSIEHVRKAIQIDPGALLVHEELQYTPFLTRRMDVTIEICQMALDLDESYYAPHAWMGMAMAWDDNRANDAVALEHLREAHRLDDGSPIALALLASVCGRIGLRDNDAALTAEAQTHLETLKEWYRAEYICPYEIATVFLALGDVEQAMDWVEMAEESNSECIPFMGVDIRMDGIREHPDYQGIMERIEHPLYGKPSPWLEDEDENKGVDPSSVRVTPASTAASG